MPARVRTIALVLMACAGLMAAGSPVTGQQPMNLEGRIIHAGSNDPVVGAVVDIYRTDVKGKYETKSDAKGGFRYPVPFNGVFTVVVSAQGLAPQFRTEVRVSAAAKPLEFTLEPGNGYRPTLDDVKNSMTATKEDPKAAEERKKLEEEHAKAVEEKGKFDARKARFDAGILAMNNKDYPTAIAELTASIEGLEGMDPEFFGELASVGGTNLAEVQYRVAVDDYNQKKKDEAKTHLEAGAKAIGLALSFNAANQVSYAIQGKILLLLIDKYGDIDDADKAAQSFRKAADLETLDPKKKVVYLVNVGDVYRAAYMTDQAIEAYKAVLATDSDNLSALYGIGLAAMGTPEQDDAKRKAVWQVAADYMKAFLDKAPNDPRAAEVKPLLDTLAKDFKIKPRPIK